MLCYRSSLQRCNVKPYPPFILNWINHHWAVVGELKRNWGRGFSAEPEGGISQLHPRPQSNAFQWGFAPYSNFFFLTCLANSFCTWIVAGQFHTYSLIWKVTVLRQRLPACAYEIISTYKCTCTTLQRCCWRWKHDQAIQMFFVLWYLYNHQTCSMVLNRRHVVITSIEKVRGVNTVFKCNR